MKKGYVGAREGEPQVCEHTGEKGGRGGQVCGCTEEKGEEAGM